MKLQNLLEDSQSEENTAEVLKFIGKDKKKILKLFSFLEDRNKRTAGRAAWMVSAIAMENPALLSAKTDQLIKLVLDADDESVRRNGLRAIMYLHPGEVSEGLLMDACFKWITSFETPPGTKANALTVLDNLSQRYPEIRGELQSVIRDQWEMESPAFRSRAKAILKPKKSKNKE